MLVVWGCWAARLVSVGQVTLREALGVVLVDEDALQACGAAVVAAAEDASVVDLYLASRHQLSLEEAAQVRSSIEYPYQSIEQVPLHPTAEEAAVAA